MEETLLNNVFVAARAEGKTAQASIDAIKACKLDWTDLKQVEAVALAYKAGHVTTALALKSDVGLNCDHTQLAVRNAIDAWSNIRARAGDAPIAARAEGKTAQAD